MKINTYRKLTHKRMSRINVMLDILIYKILENEYNWDDLRRTIIQLKKSEYIEYIESVKPFRVKTFDESHEMRKINIKNNNQDYYRYIFFDEKQFDTLWNELEIENNKFAENLSIGVVCRKKDVFINHNIKKLDLPANINRLNNIKFGTNNNTLDELNIPLSNINNSNLRHLHIHNLKIIIDYNGAFDERININELTSTFDKEHCPKNIKNLILEEHYHGLIFKFNYLPKKLNKLIILGLTNIYYKNVLLTKENIQEYLHWIPYIEWNSRTINTIWFGGKKYKFNSNPNWSLWMWTDKNAELFLKREFTKIPYGKELGRTIYHPNNIMRYLNKNNASDDIYNILDSYGLFI